MGKRAPPMAAMRKRGHEVLVCHTVGSRAKHSGHFWVARMVTGFPNRHNQREGLGEIPWPSKVGGATGVLHSLRTHPPTRGASEVCILSRWW